MKKIAIAALLLCAPISALASSYDELNAAIQLRNREEWDKALPFLDKALAAGDLTTNQKFARPSGSRRNSNPSGPSRPGSFVFHGRPGASAGAPYALEGGAALY